MELDTDFKTQLEARIKRFVAQRDELRTQLVEFNRTLNDIERRLETAGEMYRLEFGAEPPDLAGAEETTKKESRPRRSGGESWNSAVGAVLGEAHEPLHITEIWNRVQQRGFGSTAKDPLRAIASILVRHPDAVRTGPNTYARASGNGASARQQVLVPSNSDGAHDDPEEG